MLVKFLCPICNSEIEVTYIEPERCYRIDGQGEIQREDNNDAFGWIPEWQFHCGDDREHDLSKLEANELYLIWKQRVVEACLEYENPQDAEAYET